MARPSFHECIRESKGQHRESGNREDARHPFFILPMMALKGVFPRPINPKKPLGEKDNETPGYP